MYDHMFQIGRLPTSLHPTKITNIPSLLVMNTVNVRAQTALVFKRFITVRTLKRSLIVVMVTLHVFREEVFAVEPLITMRTNEGTRFGVITRYMSVQVCFFHVSFITEAALKRPVTMFHFLMLIQTRLGAKSHDTLVATVTKITVSKLSCL